MLLLDLSYDDPVKNIICDDLLLRMAEYGRIGEVLRFWESPQKFIVLGLAGKAEEDVNLENARRDRVSVLRRFSGGGTVLQGPGSLNFALALSKDIRPEIADLRRSYEYILSRVCLALAECAVEAEFFPISDIALKADRRKISGNAQKRGKKYVLHHGTLLYNFPVSSISEYLRMPNQTPDYRQGRAHADFVANASVKPEDFKVRLAAAFGAGSEGEIPSLEDELISAVDLSREKVVIL